MLPEEIFSVQGSRYRAFLTARSD